MNAQRKIHACAVTISTGLKPQGVHFEPVDEVAQEHTPAPETSRTRCDFPESPAGGAAGCSANFNCGPPAPADV
ncbi:hypothetical protein EVAR_63807_1 [Eumeta japonica]|uniref:Uncharacterized protein n=1 Tax=Eumeta variegata TaxID=151549 RepID=A0A4C1ZX80_EUMVA|nr:hypothetical protein EVAR_63807_1 [Eumeta japonica]